ncbi:MAG: hypothetical protein ACYTGZ_09110 [Planctomycetota bacterium]
MTGIVLLLLLAPNPRVPAAVAEAEAKAMEALAAGNRAEALAQFEAAIRAEPTTFAKERLRDAYKKVDWVDPRVPSPDETRAVEGLIRAEKIRVFDKAAGSLTGQGKRRAAMILRKAIIQLAGEKTKRAEQEEQKILRIIRDLTENPSDEEKEVVAKILRAKKLGKNLLKAAEKLLERREYRTVVRLCQEMMFGDFEQEIRTSAIALRKRAEEKAAADITVEEKMTALDILEDERFKRLDTTQSRHFIFLGPREFTASIPKQQKRELDLAYIYQSDLAGVQRTDDGTRIVIYYQETFDFGGGLAAAGGKFIRIGNRAIRLPIAGALHYHELGHNIFGRGWLHPGFTEGLAEFAVAYTYDSLGETKRARDFVVGCRDQFVRYFLGRAVRYDHIQQYKPSAGFLFSFLPPGEAPYDWAPYRRSFRRMREQQFGSWPARQHQLMRYFGYLMSLEYGNEAYDTLQSWGWPVSRADAAKVPAEAAELLSKTKQGESLLSRNQSDAADGLFHAVLKARPTGHLANRCRFGLLQIAIQRGDAAKVDALKRRLGILETFQVLGPFHAKKQTAWIVVPPETHVDLKQPQVRFLHRTATWKRAKVRTTGFVDLRKQGYGYPDHACAIALTYLRVDAPVRARFWLGSDDGHSLYVNGRLLQKEPRSHPFRFDDHWVDTNLVAGWNRVVLKVHNGSGNWGFLLRATQPDGTPLDGVEQSAADKEEHVPKPKAPALKSTALVDGGFRSFRSKSWLTTVGRFDTQNALLRGKETRSRGLWSRFVVDPDKPARGPANLAWLRSPTLPRARSFEAEIVVRAAGGGDNSKAPGKWGVTIDGENNNDGQSGHTFIFEPADGGKQVKCTWYRYDQQHFLQPGVAVKSAPSYAFSLRRVGTKWWVSVNGVPLFDGVDTAPLPAFGFGIMTWGTEPAFERVRFARLAPK